MSRIKVAALEKSIGKAQFYNLYNHGVGAGTSINELVSTLSRVTSRELEFSYLPGRDIDVPVNFLDISKSNKDLGWESKSL
jgi:UDP-glucose 4-epimerase